MPRRAEARRSVSSRPLGTLADERLVVLVRRGNTSAFEELFDRHSGGVLSFCSRLLGSLDEGEDAHQHAFLAVYQAIGGGSVEPRAFKPWLYTIARNRCLSMLRSRREEVLSGEEEGVAGTEQTADRVEEQAEVREILSDLRDLPELQRAALLLSEFGDLSHAQIAQVVGCPREKVKSLVFQARASLSLGRVARETPCRWVREQVAGWPLGSRLPVPLRRHLKRCEGCSEFAGAIRRRDGLIAIALPVAPTIGLKRNVLAAVGGGNGGGGGALVAKGASLSGASGGVVGETACGGLGAAVAAKAGLVVAATAGVTAVGVTVVGLAGAGGIEKPPREQDGGHRTSAGEGRSGAPERQTSLSDAVAGPGEISAGEGRSGATERQTPSSHPVVGRGEGRTRAAQRQDPPSEAPPRRTQPAPTALPATELPRVGGSLEAPRAGSAPVPDLGVTELKRDLVGPVPDLGVAGLKPDFGLLGQPVPGLGVGEVKPGLPEGW